MPLVNDIGGMILRGIAAARDIAELAATINRQNDEAFPEDCWQELDEAANRCRELLNEAFVNVALGPLAAGTRRCAGTAGM